jgi:hypothetical protein
MDPSPGPWTFAEHMYGIAHCLIDRDGRVIGCNLPISNGPLLERAPAMAQILRELVAGVSAGQLRTWAARVLERIDTGRAREPARSVSFARSARQRTRAGRSDAHERLGIDRIR